MSKKNGWLKSKTTRVAALSLLLAINVGVPIIEPHARERFPIGFWAATIAFYCFSLIVMRDVFRGTFADSRERSPSLVSLVGRISHNLHRIQPRTLTGFGILAILSAVLWLPLCLIFVGSRLDPGIAALIFMGLLFLGIGALAWRFLQTTFLGP